MLVQFKKPSFGGLFFNLLFVLICLLPIALFRIGYKFHFISKEIVLLLLLNLLVVAFFSLKGCALSLSLLHLFIITSVLTVFYLNFSSSHALAVLGLYFMLLLLISVILPADKIFLWISWSAMIATIFSFHQYWASVYGVVPAWLELSRPTGGRLAGVLGQANLMACLINVGLFSWLQTLWQRFGEEGGKWFYQIPVVIFFWALLLTGSRAGVLAFCTALLLLGWGLVRANSKNHLKRLLMSFAWTLPLGVLFYYVCMPAEVENATGRAIAFDQGSVGAGSRILFWGSALRMASDNLFAGVGLGGFRRFLGAHMSPVAEWVRIPYDSISATLWAHNDFLHVLAECGLLVFLALITVFLSALFHLWPARNPQRVFLFCGLWSFFVFMLFGHPFNDHVLVFLLVLMAAAFFQQSGKQCLSIPKRWALVLLIPCLITVNYGILSHTMRMNALGNYLKSFSSVENLSSSTLLNLQKKFRYDDLVSDPLTGWEFRYEHLLALSQLAIADFDIDLGGVIIPELEKMTQSTYSHDLTYALARLYLITGEYEKGKASADAAFQMKPNMYEYSNFGHLCLVLSISRREGIPVTDLIDFGRYSELIDQKIFVTEMFDNNLVAI